MHIKSSKNLTWTQILCLLYRNLINVNDFPNWFFDNQIYGSCWADTINMSVQNKEKRNRSTNMYFVYQTIVGSCRLYLYIINETQKLKKWWQIFHFCFGWIAGRNYKVCFPALISAPKLCFVLKYGQLKVPPPASGISLQAL